jgi:copper chaperone
VENVACDIEKKQVIVTGDADKQTMLDALLKWSQASGKSVELA